MLTLRLFLCFLAALVSVVPAWSQNDLAEIVAALKPKTPKCVVLILDVSESMKNDDYNKKMHEAAESILKEGISAGDQVVLYTFGVGYKKVFDETPQTPAARRKLLELIPLKPEQGAGTNIRQPHHEALRLAKASGKTPFLILLTDSFNDPPKTDPAAYTEYLKYYAPGKLEIYPNTPENRDYESQLSWMQSTDGKTFGLGVEILPSGRPKERFKVDPKETRLATPEPVTSTQPATMPPPQKEAFPLGLLAGVAGVAAVAILAALLRPRSLPLRVTGGGARPRDFDLQRTPSLKLGGEGGSGALDAVPLAGTREIAATIKGSRGGFTLQPQPGTSLRVYHNGLPLDKPGPLRYEDEVRVSVVDSTGAVVKENRLKFSDPTKVV